MGLLGSEGGERASRRMHHERPGCPATSHRHKGPTTDWGEVRGGRGREGRGRGREGRGRGGEGRGEGQGGEKPSSTTFP